uniref:Uncharacterized protein n=1 Tax=viral metagenome TaxID=1070528 RepID=A0A6C0DU70_9ZZZZ
MVRKTHRSKSHKRRHSRKQTRRHTRKRGGVRPICPGGTGIKPPSNTVRRPLPTRPVKPTRGGSCPCSGASAALRGQFGGRGGMGGADLGHAFTTGASQELYQMTGRTPGLSSGGGSSGVKKRREARLAQEAANRNAQRMVAEANMGENIILNRKVANANKMNRVVPPKRFRAEATPYTPSNNLLANLETNRGMRVQENYLKNLMRTQNEENANNFNNLMSKVHRNRLENGN